MVTAYLPKGIHGVRAQQDKITVLKFNDFNLGDRKNHSMLSLYKYLTKTKGKTSKIIPQLCDEPHAVHPAECHENPTLRKEPRS
jgi:hypothetical protein